MNKLVKIKSAKDFVNEIGSNKTLVLEQNCYDLSDIIMDYDKNIFFRDEFDGQELVIKNVKNLRIIGEGKNRVQIFVSPSHATVLNFYNSKNIHLENLQIGHYPEEGECSGGVLSIEDSENFTIENCELFGCGTHGILCSNLERLRVSNSLITKCNESIIGLGDCTNSKFEKCEFVNNKTYMLNFSHCNNIIFNECTIMDNSYQYYYDYEMIGVTKHCINLRDTSRKIIFNKCNIDALDKMTTNSIEFTEFNECNIRDLVSQP